LGASKAAWEGIGTVNQLSHIRNWFSMRIRLPIPVSLHSWWLKVVQRGCLSKTHCIFHEHAPDRVRTRPARLDGSPLQRWSWLQQIRPSVTQVMHALLHSCDWTLI
jgi:hypothetical protein